MFENQEKKQRAILVAADCGEWDADVSINELGELAESAGAEVVAKVIQVRSDYDKATLVGKGKLDEIRDLAEKEEADLIIFDHELTAANIRNLEEAIGVGVIDRTMLILDIFASRAQTKPEKYRLNLPNINTDFQGSKEWAKTFPDWEEASVPGDRVNPN